jgi:hypothetical protein
MTRFWVVRVSGGQFIEACRKGKYVAIGWNELGNLSWLLDEKLGESDAKKRLLELYIKTSKENRWGEKEVQWRINSGQIYRFVREIRNGDFVLSPTARRTVLLGKVIGNFYLAGKKDSCHYKQRREVEWTKEVPRDEMSQGLRNSLGAHLTVFSVSGHQKELEALIQGKRIDVKSERRYLEKEGEESIVGPVINFRGLVYSPINEQGVVFLFGKVSKDLNIEVEEIKTGFPDAICRVRTGRGYARRRMEFEFRSSDFKKHGHPIEDCDVIVCWEHDWTECPEKIEVITLQDVIKELEP